MKFILVALVACVTIVGAVGVWLAAVAGPGEPVYFSCDASEQGPGVLVCDDFEDAQFESRWDIGGHQGRFPISEFVRCADPGFGFESRCGAWSNYLTFDHEWGFYGHDARRKFPPQSAIYVRWYQYISDPFEWGSLEDKSVFLHDATNTMVQYVGTSRNHLPVVEDSGPGMPFVANYQDVDRPETGGEYEKVNRFQNQRRNITLQPGRWYLFEWYSKQNTPGKSDGEVKLWVDDASQPITSQTLRMRYTDMRWLRTQDEGKLFAEVRMTLYHQRCLGVPNTCPPNGPELLAQSQRWDHLVVSTAPIGPLRHAPGTPPAR
jgi:hypothetical protein